MELRITIVLIFQYSQVPWFLWCFDFANMSAFVKKVPQSILTFGATGHIGRPLAEFLTSNAPSIQLFLATSNPKNRDSLQISFPKAHIVIADYNDVSSLTTALDGIEGVFVVTPPSTSEKIAMINFTTALKGSNSVIYVIRLMGEFPEISPTRVPKSLGPGSLPYEHPIAKSILDNSGLPVIYLNSGATFINIFWLHIGPILEKKTLIWPEHRFLFIDPRDIGEVTTRLFLSDNAKHISLFHTMNNGQDWLTFKEVAGIMSEVFEEPIAYDGIYEAFAHYLVNNEGRANSRLPLQLLRI